MLKLIELKEIVMYTLNDFRKDYPANTMLNKIENKKSILSSLANCALAIGEFCIYAAMANVIAPTDLYETELKFNSINKIQDEYIEMHEKYDVTHEDIINEIQSL